MIQRTKGVAVCLLLMVASLSVTVSSVYAIPEPEQNSGGSHLDFLVGPQAVGWGVTIWNYGKKSVFFVAYDIEMNGVGDAKIVGGHHRGIIPCLRTKDTLFVAPLNFPKTKMIFPFGYGEVEITVHVSCKNANYDVTKTSYWILNGFKLMPYSTD